MWCHWQLSNFHDAARLLMDANDYACCQYALPSSLVQPDGSDSERFIAVELASAVKCASAGVIKTPLEVKRNSLMCFYFD